jgi:hypothetical protein
LQPAALKIADYHVHSIVEEPQVRVGTVVFGKSIKTSEDPKPQGPGHALLRTSFNALAVESVHLLFPPLRTSSSFLISPAMALRVASRPSPDIERDGWDGQALIDYDDATYGNCGSLGKV